MLNRIHTVNAHALASGDEHTLAQGEELGLFGDGEGFAVAGVEVHSRSIQKKSHVFAFGQQEVAESDGVPFDLWVGAGKDEKYLHYHSIC